MAWHFGGGGGRVGAYLFAMIHADDDIQIVIAGASGYIGHALIPDLLTKFPRATITALSRSEQRSDDPRVKWREADLFSMKSLEHAVPDKVHVAYYLVHSMGPTAQMDQGSFADYDLILADNFARVLKSKGVEQIIYLGGLVPDLAPGELSLHLRSRLEVEEVFTERGLPLTVFRAGLILGSAGSSFQILTKLVRRLPVMICPRWTQTLTTPVDLGRVVEALTTVAGRVACVGRTYDLAGCRALTYVEMMRQTAGKLNKRRAFVGVPFFTPTLSRLWVSVITGASKGLVYPLVASLEHPMVARSSYLYDPESTKQTYHALLEAVDFTPPPKPAGVVRRRFRFKRNSVRSVQRLPLPAGRDAAWMKDQYARWLPKVFAPVVRVNVDGDLVRFSLLSAKIVMLELELNRERSDPDRQLLYITGGLLAAKANTGRLEFRVVLNRRFVLAAIHDFKPALPWALYRQTQARLHLLVMSAFARFILKSKPAN